MNDFLNATIQKSHQRGRARMGYQHIRETDSFHNLSAYGLSTLPQSLQGRRDKNREPRLRITTDTRKPNNVLARIVKIPINQLHIVNPRQSYDCRISINLEVNLDRPDIDADALVAEDSADPAKRAVEVPRVKDRMSYKHLAYSIDLTRVDRHGHDPTFELELEVDSNLLRQQMQLMKASKPNAFSDVVGGFLDNATFLMRQRPSVAT